MIDCVFCKIISGEIPSSKIDEGENYFSFLDISPVQKGHALVIPKKHFQTLEEIPDDILSDVTKAVKKIAQAIMESVGAQGFNVMFNNGESAGQVVPHVHFHIVPRFSGDGLKLWPGSSYGEGEMDDIQEKIRNLL
jgi:histidine triad (HIT) family protein